MAVSHSSRDFFRHLLLCLMCGSCGPARPLLLAQFIALYLLFQHWFSRVSVPGAFSPWHDCSLPQNFSGSLQSEDPCLQISNATFPQGSR